MDEDFTGSEFEKVASVPTIGPAAEDPVLSSIPSPVPTAGDNTQHDGDYVPDVKTKPPSLRTQPLVPGFPLWFRPLSKPHVYKQGPSASKMQAIEEDRLEPLFKSPAKMVYGVQLEESDAELEPEPVTDPVPEQAPVLAADPVQEAKPKFVPVPDLVSTPEPAHETSATAEPSKQKAKSNCKTFASRKTPTSQKKNFSSQKSKKTEPPTVPGYMRSKAKFVKFFLRLIWNSRIICLKEKFLCEKTISIANHENLGIVDFLKEKGLFGSVTKPKGFVGALVHEFYSNLPSDIRETSSRRYYKVNVRDHVFDFSHALINNYLECIK